MPPRGAMRALVPPTLMALAIWWANQHGYLLGLTLAELMNNQGTLFDPEVVGAAVRLVRERSYALPT